MEVLDPRLVYSGAQRSGAVVSDIEVVPDTEDEATMPDPSTEARDAMPSSTMADRQCPYHLNLEDTDIEDEVSRRSIEVAVVHNSPAMGQGRSETICSEVTTSEYQGLPTKPQQRYDPMRRGEASSRHSRQSDSKASGIMYRRRRRVQDTGMRRSSEQRRSFEDLRAELTEKLRFQQAMFLSARDQLAARQDEMFTQTQVAIEGLRSSQTDAHDAHSSNDNRRVQSPSTQVVGVVRGPSALQDSGTVIPESRVYAPKDISQSSHQAAVVQLAQGDHMSQSDGSRGPSRGNALVDAASVVGPRHEAARQCSPYELGGQGIPQMMTGGMPSGVPPSVYRTPVDALSQQYTTRESQMITGGMPSGIPPSVYRTPVDALSYPLVNRQLMNSQLANANGSEYSPELFTPLDTPYYM